MKWILRLIVAIVFLQGACFAASDVTFIYINGSNTNDAKNKNWFVDGIAKFHPVLIKKIEKAQSFDNIALNNHKSNINPQPKIFFWGDKSKDDIEFMQTRLKNTKSFVATGAYQARSLISAYLHDAIWIQKTYHMAPTLDALNESVKEEYKNGKKVVLYGYSAGSFITYNYMFTRYRYIDMADLFKDAKVSDNLYKFVSTHPQKRTCLAALGEGRLGIVTPKGHLIVDDIESRFKQNYLKMNEVTEQVCAPADTVLGVVNYASPLVLFYSDIADPKYEFNYYNRFMLDYIMENGLFFVTVNFREDPLGIPVTQNLTVKEMEEKTQLPMTSPSGVIYDNSSVKSWRTFIIAHTSYYSARGKFANAIVKTLDEGYRFQYDKEFQAKMLKKRK